MRGGSLAGKLAAAVVAVGLLSAAGASAVKSRARPSPQLPLRGAVLRVPHAAGAVSLDGDMDDPGWLRASPARTNAFVLDDGSPARPYSDARLVWGDGQLYVALYAADQDIRATQTEPDAPLWLEDSFHLVFSDGEREQTIDVSARGVVTDAQRVRGGALDYGWSSGALVSRDVDGTLDDPSDDDEEWVLEIAIPLESLGLTGERGERVAFSVSRCDSPKKARRVCASWNAGEPGVAVLD